MNTLSHLVKTLAASAALIAVVFFGGRLFTTGSVTQQEETFVPVVTIEKEAPHTEAIAQVEDAPFVPTAQAGKRVAGKCKACHSFKQGDTAKKTGPNLWGIVGRDIAAVEGFKYSAAFNAEKGNIVWDEESITAYLTKPKDYIPGNKMAFAGLRKEEDRQNIIAYLNTLK